MRIAPPASEFLKDKDGENGSDADSGDVDEKGHSDDTSLTVSRIDVRIPNAWTRQQLTTAEPMKYIYGALRTWKFLRRRFLGRFESRNVVIRSFREEVTGGALKRPG